MTWGAVAGAAVAAVGTAVSANSASKARKSQEAAARDANATQMAQYDQTRMDQKPWMDRGNAAGNRLNILLGLDPQASGMVPQLESPDEIRARLAPTYRSLKLAPQDYTSKLNAAVMAEMAKQKAAAAQYKADPVTNDSDYGSLMRNFQQSDLDSDVVYQSGLKFGLDEGTKGINRLFSAQGGTQSGAALKALTRFGNDYGSTKANESYNRFNTNKLNKFNMLSGVAGTGQAANNQVGAAGQNMANNVSQNQIGVGNARGSAYIAQGNALTNGISQGYNAWQQYRGMQQPQQAWWNSAEGINANGGGF